MCGALWLPAVSQLPPTPERALVNVHEMAVKSMAIRPDVVDLIIVCSHVAGLCLLFIRAKDSKQQPSQDNQQVPAVLATAMMMNRWFLLEAYRQIQVRIRMTIRARVTILSKPKLPKNVFRKMFRKITNRESTQ